MEFRETFNQTKAAAFRPPVLGGGTSARSRGSAPSGVAGVLRGTQAELLGVCWSQGGSHCSSGNKAVPCMVYQAYELSPETKIFQLLSPPSECEHRKRCRAGAVGGRGPACSHRGGEQEAGGGGGR